MSITLPYEGGLLPGIYFGLTEARYHGDKAVSRGDCVLLLDSANSYWAKSWMNPNPGNRRSSAPMEYGSAFHVLLFEPHLFSKKYMILGLNAWDASKERITLDNYNKIYNSIKVLRGSEEANKLLKGGMGEVTIIFDYEGIRYRTRHDYFGPVITTDYKTARELHDTHLKREFWDRGLDIQMALYLLSRRCLRKQLMAGEAHVYGKGDVVQKLMAKFMASSSDGFAFIFQRSDHPHPFRLIFTEDDTEEQGLKRLHRASLIWKKSFDQYGEKEWPACEGKPERFSMFFGSMES